MPKPQVFYSFHFDYDVFRVQLIRHIGVIEGNEPVSKNDWERAGRTPGGIEKWIDENMKYKTHIVVLVGLETAHRRWVDYEIRKGWDDGKGVVGIYIHNLRDPRYSNIPPRFGKCSKGADPFAQIELKNDLLLSQYVNCHDPNPADAYNDIAQNLTTWIENAARRGRS